MTFRASFQINKTRKGVTIRDEHGVRKISEKKARSVRRHCIEGGFSVWSASDKVEHYFKLPKAKDRPIDGLAYEVEVFDFRDEGHIIVRFSLRRGVYLAAPCRTKNFSRGADLRWALCRFGFEEVRKWGVTSAKKGSYRLFRADLEDCGELMAENFFSHVD